MFLKYKLKVRMISNQKEKYYKILVEEK